MKLNINKNWHEDLERTYVKAIQEMTTKRVIFE